MRHDEDVAGVGQLGRVGAKAGPMDSFPESTPLDLAHHLFVPLHSSDQQEMDRVVRGNVVQGLHQHLDPLATAGAADEAGTNASDGIPNSDRSAGSAWYQLRS